jgi:hypothetical protein
MRTDPNDIFRNFSRFKEEIINILNSASDEPTAAVTKRPFKRPDQHRLFNKEDMYHFVTYLQDLHGLDITGPIRKGVCTDRNIEEYATESSFLWSNPQLMFYQYILLKDSDHKYNIGYFRESISRMIREIVELNIFFLDVYILCKVLDNIFDFKKLDYKSKTGKTPLKISFNNLIFVGYEDGKIQLTVTEDGFRSFKSYRTGKINLGLYAENDLLFCDKVSVPRFKEDDRESIYNGDIGEGNWSKLILPPEPATGTATQKENDIYEEIDNWLKTLGLLPAIS